MGFLTSLCDLSSEFKPSVNKNQMRWFPSLSRYNLFHFPVIGAISTIVFVKDFVSFIYVRLSDFF